MLYLGEHHSLRCIPASCLYTGSHAWEARNSLCSTGRTGRGLVRVIREISLWRVAWGVWQDPLTANSAE